MKKVIILCTILCSIDTFAQSPPPDAPNVQWRSMDWPQRDRHGFFQTREQSGEDWWYSHENKYDEYNNHVGYIAVGYSTFINDYLDSQNECWNRQQNCPNCRDFEGPNFKKGDDWGWIGEYELSGKMKWCKTYVHGHLQKMVIDEDENYVAVGLSGSILDLDGNPIAYNPGENETSGRNYFEEGSSCNVGDNMRHIIVMKTNPNGEVLWMYKYGAIDFNPSNSGLDAYFSQSEGFDLVENDLGYLVVSKASLTAMPNTVYYPFIFQLDKDGELLWKKSYHGVVDNDNFESGEFVAIEKYYDATAQVWQYAVVGREIESSFFKGYALFFDESNVDGQGRLIHEWKRIFGINHSLGHNEKIWDVKFQNNGRILVPLMNGQGTNFFAGVNIANGFVYILNRSNGNNALSPVSLGEIRAFDLKIGITPTADNGFAIVTSKWDPKKWDNENRPSLSDEDILNALYRSYRCEDFCNVTQCEDHSMCIGQNAIVNQLGEITNEAFFNSFYGNGIFLFMETDAYVAKFDVNGALEWDTYFDSDDLPRSEYPGDVKKQECLYYITQAGDGGLVVSGNTSHNFDDGYLAKLYGDCQSNLTYNVEEPSTNIIEITSNTIWNTNKKVLGSVRVKNGATLSITNGITVELAETKATGITTNICVEPGGRLYVNDDVTLTSIQDCPVTVWDGIQVWGNGDTQYGTGSAGIAIFENATINNARDAVVNHRPGFWGNRGGIIQAVNTTFINNRRSVEFISFQNNFRGQIYDDLSYFTTCTFDYNENSHFLNPDFAHVTMWDTKGITFRGCEFKNSTLNPRFKFAEIEYGKGIATLDASFTVRDACVGHPNCPPGTWVKSKFNNLYIGIDAGISSTSKPFEVYNTEFEDNYYGVYAKGTHLSDVNRNTFTVGIPKKYFDTGIGVYFEGFTDYNLNENTFYLTTEPDPLAITYGSVIDNSGTDENIVYRNQYNDILLGNLAVNTNASNPNNTGLQYLCNENNDIAADFIVQGFGIREGQGISSKSAGNIFSNILGFINMGDYINVGKDIVYFYDNGARKEPLYYTTASIDILLANITNQCLTNYPGDEMLMMQTESGGIETEWEQWQLFKNQLHNLTDGGNTDALLAAIQTAWTKDVWDLRADLLSKSPFLSEDAIFILIAERPLPDAMMLEVLAANPDISSKNKTLGFIQEQYPPYPEYFIYQLSGLKDSITAKTQLLSEISQAFINLRNKRNQLIRNAWFVSDSLHTQDLTALLSTYSSFGSSMMLADFTSSNTAVFADVYENAKDEFESENALKMLEYNQTLNTYITSKSELPGVAKNKELMEYLHQTAQDTSWAGTRASALLNFFAGSNYYHKPVLKEPLFTQKTSKKQTQSDNLSLPETEFAVNVYPNPASSWLSFEYELKPDANVWIEIFDMDGRLVQNITLQQQAKQVILDIRNWKQGTYLYRIVASYGKINSGKFMIVK